MALYAVTIFLSAFLLFQIQPLIAKIILPWFGGSAAVWSASLLFFQLVLLAGYTYAHLSIKYLKARGQMMLHAALLLASCLILRPTFGIGDSVPAVRALEFRIAARAHQFSFSRGADARFSHAGIFVEHRLRRLRACVRVHGVGQ
jgi:hypothetical protein